MNNNFKRGWLVKSVKQEDVIYMVDTDNGDTLKCLRLDDMYYYTIPKNDVVFYFSVEMLDASTQQNK